MPPAQPPPAGVDGAHGPPDRVVEQGVTPQSAENTTRGQVRRAGDQGVGAFKIPRPPQTHAGVRFAAGADGSLMDLPGQHYPGHVRPHRAAEAAVVLLQGRLGIPAAGTQVQGVPGRGGHAPPPGGEPVGDSEQEEVSQTRPLCSWS